MISCPICRSNQTFVFLSRKQVPVHQNLVSLDQESALEVERGDLNLSCCRECGFIFNAAFDVSKLKYGENYDNAQTYSGFFQEYLKERANYLISEKVLRDSVIVEVGCGKGEFLKLLTVEESNGNVGYGFDPSYVGETTLFDGRLRFEKRLYGTDCVEVKADAVICRHVVEHITDPLMLLSRIKSALKNSPQARVFFETPCAEWILRNKVIWDFFYEHCSLFTIHSLTTLFDVSGFEVIDIEHVFNGQYLWLEAHLGQGKKPSKRSPGNIPQLAEQFTPAEDILIKKWKNSLKQLSEKGKVAIWGGGSKGVTFINLVDFERKLIDSVVDLNSRKQGKFIPGTGHPIISYRNLPERGITDVVLMNPNYYSEVKMLLHNNNINVNLLH
ncbi:MAG: class I SAM-dependent methyltransferase [Candidatus Omnitrophica bacterium]|nr:class I SAM-dependent methyltransferase [Candidatus Omnitrophota bacterium]